MTGVTYVVVSVMLKERSIRSWKTVTDTRKCKATMRLVLESYIKERRKAHKTTRAFEILMVGNNKLH